MTATIETELRSALSMLEDARDELAHAVTVECRAVVYREISAAQTSIYRVLHLIAGTAATGDRP